VHPYYINVIAVYCSLWIGRISDISRGRYENNCECDDDDDDSLGQKINFQEINLKGTTDKILVYYSIEKTNPSSY
jgi:hypothetical protein